ncbi:MAG: aminotransferase class V-fold PLP-dependent enzyme, partial [Desulfomonilaceae bacterium]
NVPGIVALGVAAELAQKHMAEKAAHMARLRDRLQEGLLAAIPHSHVNGALDPRLPNTLNIGFEFVEGEAILMRMDEKGICASSGSACTSGSLEPSHVLRAMGVPFTAVHGSIRFSLSRYTTDEEIDFVLDEVPKIIAFLRSLSPFGRTDFDRACVVQ